MIGSLPDFLSWKTVEDLALWRAAIPDLRFAKINVSEIILPFEIKVVIIGF